MIVGFIDEHRHEHGVEPMCQVLDIAPSTHWRHKQLRLNHRRLLGPLGYIPPAEAEADYYRANAPAEAPAGLTPQALR